MDVRIGGALSNTCTLPGMQEATWSPVPVAPYYGAFSGLLAGFCIAGLFWLVSRKQSRIDFGAVIGLWTSVLPLALAALLYYEVTGNRDCRGAVYDILAPSLLLPIGAATIFFYLGRLIENVAAQGERKSSDAIFYREAGSASRLVSWAAVTIGTISVATMNIIVLDLAKADRRFAFAQAGLVGVSLLAVASTRGPNPWRHGKPDQIRRFHKRSLVILAITFVAFLGGLTTALGATPTDTWYYIGTSVRSALWSAFLFALLGWRERHGASAAEV
jgi:hypothetical protein